VIIFLLLNCLLPSEIQAVDRRLSSVVSAIKKILVFSSSAGYEEYTDLISHAFVMKSIWMTYNLSFLRRCSSAIRWKNWKAEAFKYKSSFKHEEEKLSPDFRLFLHSLISVA
jgi:hypothetical protein